MRQAYHMAMAAWQWPGETTMVHGLLSNGSRPVLCYRAGDGWMDERGVRIRVLADDMFFPVAG